MKRLISGCTFREREEEDLRISHKLFAGDTIVFCGPSKDRLLHLSWVLLV